MDEDGPEADPEMSRTKFCRKFDFRKYANNLFENEEKFHDFIRSYFNSEDLEAFVTNLKEFLKECLSRANIYKRLMHDSNAKWSDLLDDEKLFNCIKYSCAV
eukprot:TRINITY_DN15035_c0_g1_i1.p1 TRINITY_DN15035_c0_g1~~TRINITY_DN15035_c0_g1_i1.p1  ORF type:complete len:102 (-),score=17.41 TRINITY_DN15035_c0_g1_i1:78-383(-)